MASMELSLDEIIKKSKINVKAKGGFKKFGGNNAGNNRGNAPGIPIRRPGGVQQRRIGGTTANTVRGGGQNARPNIRASTGGIQKPIGDARNRIIQKKRLHLTDARDKLCELAKKTDARQKLEKLRLLRLGHNGMQAPLGYGLSTRKVPLPPFKGIHARTGLGSLIPASIPLQRTISQPISHSRYPSKVPPLMDMDIDLGDEYMTDGPIQLRRTVNNDQMRMQPLLRPSKLSISSPYSWKAPQQPAIPAGSNRGYIDLDYPAEQKKRMKLPSPPPMMRPIVVSDDDDMPEPVRHSARSSRTTSGNSMGVLKTRLEPSRAQPSSIPSASSSVSSGYRIVVSNLQSSVTHEDIRELFEDIGPLVTSRLVRPGTAEVVYRQYKDAERAVENYHNRQLDGQPMKCLLVKPRPSTASSAAPSSAGLRASVAASAKSNSGKPSVVPDISTIHKALFNKA